MKEKQIKVWVSSVKLDNSGMEKELERQEDIQFLRQGKTGDILPIYIDSRYRYQKMDGFGISITEGSAYLCKEILKEDQEKELMKLLFSKNEGIGISMLRQPVGASDHCTEPYVFAEKEQASELPDFQMKIEEDRIIPVLEKAKKYADCELKILVAPWSAPAWMKTNASVLGVDIETCKPGMLKQECYSAYAKYLTKFIKEYEKRGLSVYGISLLNEPDFANFSWPTMAMKPEQAAVLAAEYLYPELKKNGLAPKLMCWDHNFDSFNYEDGEYVDQYFSNEKAKEITAGSAWHWYEGDCTTLTGIKRKYPEKEIWLTEASGGEWGYRQWKDAFLYQARNTIRICRNFSQSLIYWNMVLDNYGGPDYYYMKMEGEHSQNRGLITIERETGKLQKNTDYFTLGHFSKFVVPGAVRIESGSYDAEGMNSAAFLNPDGDTVLVVSNEHDRKRSIRIVCGDMEAYYELDPLSMTTFCWEDQLDPPTYGELVFHDCSNEENIEAGENILIHKMKNTSEERGIRMIHKGTPKDKRKRCIKIGYMGKEEAADINGYGYFVFSAKNLRYYKGFPATVSFYDTEGRSFCTVTKEPAVYDCWQDIYVPLEGMYGIDRSCISRIEIAFESQDRDIFLIDRLRFTVGYEELVETGGGEGR